MRNSMRVFVLFLSFVMILGVLPAWAEVATIYQYVGTSHAEHVRSIAYWDSTVYLFTDNYGLYTYTADEGLVERPFDTSFLKRADGEWDELNAVVAGEDGLYAVILAFEPDGNWRAFDRANLFKMEISADSTVSLDAGVRLDWDDLDPGEGFSIEARFPAFLGDQLALAAAVDFYNDGRLFVFDRETGDCVVHEVGKGFTSIEGFCAYGEGRVIVSTCDRTSGAGVNALGILDLTSGAVESLYVQGDDVQGDDVIANLAYDVASDTLYYTFAGQLFRMPGLDPEKSEPLASVPLGREVVAASVLTGEGTILVGDASSVLLRMTEPVPEEEVKLTVYTGGMNVMYDAERAFSKAHPDVELVIKRSVEDVTQAMLSRSSAVDIYAYQINLREYGALYNRGYLADLSDSEAISAYVDGLYPGIRDAVTIDGAPVAVPLDCYPDGMSYNPVALQKLGLTEADLPTTWPEYFQFILDYADLAAEKGISMYDPYMDIEFYRAQHMFPILNQYMVWLMQAEDTEPVFDTDIMRDILEGLDQLDYAALGILEEMVEGTFEYDASTVLFDSTSFYIEGFSAQLDDRSPLPLALAEGMEPIIPSTVVAAFVNPYSKHPELAAEYLEHVIEVLPQSLVMTISPDQNASLRSPDYEKNVAYYAKELALAEAELTKADEADRDAWEKKVEVLTKTLESVRESWEVSAEDIEQYRRISRYFAAQEYFGLGEDNLQEFYEMFYQYNEGSIGADELLQGLDKKVKMMLLEDR